MLKDSGRFPIPARPETQLNPASNHIVLLRTSQRGEGFYLCTSEAPSDLVNQSGSTEYALNPCPSATGRTNNTDPHKTSTLHSAIQPLAGICIPPETCNKKGSDEAGTHMADEGRNPNRGLDVWLEKPLVHNQHSSHKYSLAWQQLHLREVRRHLYRSEQQSLSCLCQDQVLRPPFPLSKVFTPAA